VGLSSIVSEWKLLFAIVIEISCTMSQSLSRLIIAGPGSAVEGIVRTAAIKPGLSSVAGMVKNVVRAKRLSPLINDAFLKAVAAAIVTGSPGRGFSGIIV
jgi:hypothetical protein